MEQVYGPGPAAIDQNAPFRPGQPGHRVGGKVQLCLQNVTDGRAVLLGRDDSCDGLHGGASFPNDNRIPQNGKKEKRH